MGKGLYREARKAKKMAKKGSTLAALNAWVANDHRDEEGHKMINFGEHKYDYDVYSDRDPNAPKFSKVYMLSDIDIDWAYQVKEGIANKVKFLEHVDVTYSFITSETVGFWLEEGWRYKNVHIDGDNHGSDIIHHNSDISLRYWLRLFDKRYNSDAQEFYNWFVLFILDY